MADPSSLRPPFFTLFSQNSSETERNTSFENVILILLLQIFLMNYWIKFFISLLFHTFVGGLENQFEIKCERTTFPDFQ